VLERRGHEVGILQRQVFVIEQHVDCGCTLPSGEESRYPDSKRTIIKNLAASPAATL
jgi:hypothetical protein